VFADKLRDVMPELVADAADALPMFCGLFDGGGVLEVPLVPPDRAGKDGAGSLLLPVAKKNVTRSPK
jgi:hypothetical protein